MSNCPVLCFASSFIVSMLHQSELFIVMLYVGIRDFNHLLKLVSCPAAFTFTFTRIAMDTSLHLSTSVSSCIRMFNVRWWPIHELFLFWPKTTKRVCNGKLFDCKTALMAFF